MKTLQHTLKYRIILLIAALFLTGGIAKGQEDDSRFFKDSSYYKLTTVSVNLSGYADWGGFYHDGILYFSSNRPKPRPDRLIRYTDVETKTHFYTLYKSVVDSAGSYGDVEKFANELNQKYNVGPIYITPDGKTMIVTRNITKKSETYKNKGSHMYEYILQLYFYTYDESKKEWGNEQAFPYNSNQYNCAHAYLSQDGQKLYFSSDMPGTVGGMDIFVSAKEGNSWGLPRNLGTVVNTAGNETFPTLSEDGSILYFSSDRPGGMGGWDIYRIDLPVKTSSEAHNLGYPVNTAFDDFGLVFYRESSDGYLASNRPLKINEKDKEMDLSDNIYHLHSTYPNTKLYTLRVVDSLTGNPIAVNLLSSCPDSQPLTKSLAKGETCTDIPLLADTPCNFELTKTPFAPFKTTIIPNKNERDIVLKVPLCAQLVGTVVTNKGYPVSNAVVTVTDSNGEPQTFRTDSKGQFLKPCFLGGRTLAATATHGIMKSQTEEVVIPSDPEELLPEYSVVLELEMPERLIMSAEVLFDFDKYDITPRAKDTLDMVVEALSWQTDVTMVLEGHTDSRGTAAYNKVLSLRRANSVKDYMVKHGIAPNRMQTVGYGFDRLVNGCKKGVECTDEEHQLNRRVEFIFNKKVEKKRK